MEVTSPTKVVSLTIASGAAVSQAFPLMDFIGGKIIVPSEWTDANIGFKVCDSQDGTFVIACKDDGTPIQISGVTTNASKAYKIPNELFPAHHVKLWSKSTTAATTTDTNQGAARSLTVMLK
jgi:hypothetical protein